MATQENSFISTLYNSRKNLLKQLKHLDYDISNFEHYSINELYNLHQHGELSFLVSNENKKKKKILYHISKCLRPSHLYDYIELYFNSDELIANNDELCIIIKEKVNSSIKAALEEIFNEENIFITVRSIKSLLFNILENSTVPPHTILSKEETEHFYKTYNIKSNTQVPEISRFDPVAVTIGLRPREICKILRPNKTSVTSEYYRICC
jgi:DNA-directed RNA polymerase subunit H (RpoH/RPB5)